GGDGELVEPVDAVEASKFYLAQSTVELGPAEDAFDQFAPPLTYRAHRIRLFGLGEMIFTQVAVDILAQMRRHPALAQHGDELGGLILRVGAEGAGSLPGIRYAVQHAQGRGT